MPPKRSASCSRMLPPGCTDTPQLDCVDRATYLHDLFLASDTTVAVLTDVPNSGPSNAPIPFPEALSTQQITAGLARGGASRLLVENIIAPNVGPVEATLDEMSSAVAVRAAGGVQGVHGLEPERPGLLAGGSRPSVCRPSSTPTTSASRSSSRTRASRS